MTFRLLIATIIFFFSIAASAQDSDAITGKYKNEERKDTIIIYKAADGFYYGKDPAGQTVLHKLKYDADKKRYEGKLMPPGKDFSMNAVISFESVNRLKMVVTKFVISKTSYLTKL